MTSSENNSHESPSRAARTADYIRFKHYAAWTLIIASPILIALPPRKLDLYTVALSGTFLVSANHLVRERTGRSIPETIGKRFQHKASMLQELPSERARELQAKLRAAKDAQVRDGELEKDQWRRRGLAENLWMGNETEGWKERRLREEQKAIAEGKGYGDLIMEHILEVVNWGKPNSRSENSKDSGESR
ncbi:hypothetical protein V8E54_003060 [Elaphomyces granulatus]